MVGMGEVGPEKGFLFHEKGGALGMLFTISPYKREFFT